MKHLTIFPMDKEFKPILPYWAGVGGRPFSGIEVKGDEVWKLDDPPSPQIGVDYRPNRDNRLSGELTLTANQIIAIEPDLLIADMCYLSLILHYTHPSDSEQEMAILIPRATLLQSAPPRFIREHEDEIKSKGSYEQTYKFDSYLTDTMPWGQRALQECGMVRVYAVNYRTPGQLRLDLFGGDVCQHNFFFSRRCLDLKSLNICVDGKSHDSLIMAHGTHFRFEIPSAPGALISALYPAGQPRLETPVIDAQA